MYILYYYDDILFIFLFFLLFLIMIYVFLIKTSIFAKLLHRLCGVLGLQGAHFEYDWSTQTSSESRYTHPKILLKIAGTFHTPVYEKYFLHFFLTLKSLSNADRLLHIDIIYFIHLLIICL